METQSNEFVVGRLRLKAWTDLLGLFVVTNSFIVVLEDQAPVCFVDMDLLKEVQVCSMAFLLCKVCQEGDEHLH